MLREKESSEQSPRGLSTHDESTCVGNGAHDGLAAATKKAPDSDAQVNEEDDTTKSKAKAPKPGLANFFRLLRYSNAMDRLLMSMAAICAFAAGATLPLMILVFGRIVANFTGYFQLGSSVEQRDFLNTVDQNSSYIFYLFLAKFVLGYISIYVFRITGIKISARVRMDYLTNLFDQPIAAIDELPAGAATDSLTTAANTIQLAVSDKLGLLCQAIALLISAYIVAFVSSWSLTLVSSSVIVFIMLVYGAVTPVFFKFENQILESQTSASGVANEVFRAIRTVKSLCAEASVTDRYAGWVHRARQAGLKKSPVTGAQFAPAFFAIYANMGLTFWFGVKLFTWNDIRDVGTIITVLFSVLIVTTAVGGIFAPMQSILKAASASDLLFRVIDAPMLREGGIRSPDADATDDLRFENVRFTYPTRPHSEILRGLNLSIPSGKVTALVGSSGCGKSTIVALLERWYELSHTNEELQLVEDKNVTDAAAAKKDKTRKEEKKKKSTKVDKSERSSHDLERSEAKPAMDQGPVIQNAGCIRIGKHNIEDLDRKWWRAQIGLVQQEPFLFNETIIDNVAKGLIGSDWEHAATQQKRELVEEACREAFADEFIRRLPEGYDAMVGEGGIKLSGGQRQRLAIARSIISKPAILILDEATSAIDVRSEQVVEAALERASKGRTTITIAHRLATIRKADHIVVLKEGAAVEEGTHAELIAKEDGAYAALVNAQHMEIGSDGEGNGDDEVDHTGSDDPADLQLKESESAFSPNDKDKADIQSVETVKQRGFFRSVGRLLYEQRQHRLIYISILLGALGAGAAYPIQAWLLSKVIVVFTYTGSDFVSEANFYALMLFVLSLGVAVAYAIIGYTTNSLSVHVSTAYRQRYFESMLHKPIPWYDHEDHSSGSLTAKLSGDPQQLQEILGPNMALPLIAIFNILGCAIISFVFGWKLTLVVFFASLPVILGAAFLRMRYELAFEKLNNVVFEKSSKFAAESISAFRTVASLTMEDSITARYDQLLDDQISQASKKARWTVLVFALSDSIELAAMALAFWYGGQLLASREYNPEQFFVVYTAIIQGGQAAGQFLGFGPNIAQATAAANRILAIRDQLHSATPMNPTTNTGSNGMEIEFRDVGFSYPLRNVPVYRKLSFTIARGQYVAFVGPSGCGKTTVISLLERFYAPSSGEVLVDDANLTHLPMADYRGSVALVSQEPTLFEGSVTDNLAMGLKAVPTQSSIEEACRAAEIFDFIVSLPQGFDTPLSAGTHASLSGGQKQRLCIARALLRKPRLLLLDEATSSLDSQSERLVQKAIEKVAANKSVTIVVVAHRLATVQNADRIVVLGDGGKILEEGNHTELLSRRGTYWTMCQSQALDR